MLGDSKSKWLGYKCSSDVLFQFFTWLTLVFLIGIDSEGIVEASPLCSLKIPSNTHVLIELDVTQSRE